MQVNSNYSAGHLTGARKDSVHSAKTPIAPHTPNFQGAENLERALAATPDVRSDEVERARELIGRVDYPPRQTIERIASLLAIELEKENPLLDPPLDS